tara:strand:- start:1153 stop:1335 length:183 start_codon:yes stop_codon:yes gene_type:complete
VFIWCLKFLRLNYIFSAIFPPVNFNALLKLYLPRTEDKISGTRQTGMPQFDGGKEETNNA